MVRPNKFYLVFSICLNLMLLYILINTPPDQINRIEKDYDENFRPLIFHNHMSRPRLSEIIDTYINQKLIFILGSMSSGTTMMRLVLDTHPEVNCGEETKIIELLLSFIGTTTVNHYFMDFIQKSGVKNETIEKATAMFIYYIMENNLKTKNLTALKSVINCRTCTIKSYTGVCPFAARISEHSTILFLSFPYLKV